MILKSENVLTPQSIKKVIPILLGAPNLIFSFQMMEIHTALMEMKVDGKNFEDICTR